MDQNYHTEFLTATIYNWEHLLIEDDLKHIVLNSFQWLVTNKKCTINAFVIMPNHSHLLWKISDGFERKDVQGALFSFTAHEFKKCLKKKNSMLLEKHFVIAQIETFNFGRENLWLRNAGPGSFFSKS